MLAKSVHVGLPTALQATGLLGVTSQAQLDLPTVPGAFGGRAGIRTGR